MKEAFINRLKHGFASYYTRETGKKATYNQKNNVMTFYTLTDKKIVGQFTDEMRNQMQKNVWEYIKLEIEINKRAGNA